MPNITLQNIADLLKEELRPVNERLGTVGTRLTTIETTLNTHIAALEQLLT